MDSVSRLIQSPLLHPRDVCAWALPRGEQQEPSPHATQDPAASLLASVLVLNTVQVCLNQSEACAVGLTGGCPQVHWGLNAGAHYGQTDATPRR